MFVFLALAGYFALQAFAQSFSPGNVPITARSIFFNSRLVTSASGSPANLWPTLSPFSVTNLGWAGLVKVDNVTYSWLGQSPGYNGTVLRNPNLTGTILTPTKTTFVLAVGSQIQLNITFFDPISPGDFVRWSTPLSYLSIDILSLDGAPHDIQVYSDVQGTWLSNDYTQAMTWSTLITSPNIIHTSMLQIQQQYAANGDLANWGSMYFAMPAGPGTSWKIDSDQNCRTLFEVQGKLDNTSITPSPRAIADRSPTLALSQDLGRISSTTQPVVFAIGLLRSPATRLDSLSQAPQDRFFFYETAYSDPTALVNDFLANYSQALITAQNVDASLMSAANSASSGGALGDLVTLATRQVIGNTELTAAKGSDGKWNQSDVMLFVREPVSNRAQPVELLYASFPMFMTIDPSLGKLLLEPLLRLQSSQQYRDSFDYAAQDLSSTYPIVTLASQVHSQGVEQTSNMLIMSYAQVRFSGDPSLVEGYYTLLTSWADYLANSSLALENQTTADSASPNDPNLGIKGIIGIKAMSEIASVLGVSGDAKRYADEANNLYTQWKLIGALTANGNLAASFNSSVASSSIGYNLFADKWLNLSVVESEIYGTQTALVENLMATNSEKYGLPIVTTTNNTVITSWNMFIAAFMTQGLVRDSLIGGVHTWTGSNQFRDPWPLTYDATTGANSSGLSSPGQGAAFAPIALSIPARAVVPSPSSSPPTSPSPSDRRHKSNTGIIVGAVIGGIAGLIALSTIVLFVRRRQRRIPDAVVAEPVHETSEASPSTDQMVQPFQLEHNTATGDILSSTINSPHLPLDPRGPGGTPLSSKELMYLRHGVASAVPPDIPNPTTITGLSGDTALVTNSNSHTSEAGQEVRDSADVLMAEIDRLRSEVAQMRAAGLEFELEPPPTYQ